MDPYDPRKRLKVLSSANPSLRVSVAPAQQLKVTTAQQPQLNVTAANEPQHLFSGGQPVQNNVPEQQPIPQAENHAPQHWWEKAGSLVFGNTAKFLNTASAGITGLIGLNQIAKESLFGTDKSYADKVKEVNQNLNYALNKNENPGLFKEGTFFKDRKEAQNISAGSLAKKTTGAGLGVGAEVIPFMKGGQLVEAGGKLLVPAGEEGAKFVLPKFAPTALKAVAEGTGYGAAQSAGAQLVENGKINPKETALSALVGGVAGGTTFGVGRGIFKLRGGEEAAANRIISKIASTDSSQKIESILSKAMPDLDNKFVKDTASYLAQESDKKAVKNILESIDPSNPNLRPGVYSAYSPDPTQLPEGMVPPAQEGTPNAGLSDADFLKLQQDALDLADNQTKDSEDLIRGAEPDQWKRDLAQAEADARKTAAAADQFGLGGSTPDFVAGSVTAQDVQNIADNLAGTQDKGAIGETLFGQDGLLNSANLDDATKASIVDTVSNETNPGKVADEVQAAIEGANKATIDNTAKDVAAASVEQTPQAEIAKAVEAAPSQSGAAAPTIDQTGQVAAEQATPATTLGQEVSNSADEAAAKLHPDNGPTTQKSVQQVLDALDQAQGSYDQAQATRATERASRAAAAEEAYKAAGGGEAGMRAKLNALRGKYAESGYNPIQIDEATQKTLLDDVANSDLRSFEKTNTQNAMRKMWGSIPGKPTAADIKYIRDYFGNDVADAIEKAVEQSPESWRQKAFGIAGEAIGTPRSIMASFDISGTLRQGGFLASRFPKEAARAFKEQIKYLASKDAFENGMREIAARPSYEDMVNSGLAIDAAKGITNTEEKFVANIADKIPGVGASDRAYSGFLARFRADVFDTMTKGKGLDQKELDGISKFINAATGRGDFGQFLEKHSQTLSTALFSPRLWKSRLDLLNPVFYAKLPSEARKYALQTAGSFAAEVSAVLGLAAAAGASVETDMRSSDFGKIKVGNTRYDILGGLQQNLVFAWRELTGEKKNSETGDVTKFARGISDIAHGRNDAQAGVESGPYTPTRTSIAGSIITNKENPVLATGTRIFSGKDMGGNPVNPLTELAKLAIPLPISGTYSTIDSLGDKKNIGNIIKGTVMNSPDIIGISTQTYGPSGNKDSNGKYSGKISDNMVTDKGGNPFLDKKGAPVTVKFPDNATDLEKQALINEERNKQYKKQAEGLLSNSDREIYNVGNNDKTLLNKDQLAKYNDISKWVDSYGRETEIPDGVKSPGATAFYQKWNTMNKKDQEAWLSQPADDNAKQITDALNKQRNKGLSAFKPSNAVAKAYAEYEKDINSHPEYTNVDKQNKAKAFQKFVYKLNYSTQQRDIYSEGPSADLKALINDGQIDKKDLDQAVKMDDELYNSGLTGTLKFSKKFRASMGYGLPSGGGVNKNLASGGNGKSSKTEKTYISQLLPSFKNVGSAGSKPTFSSKVRTTKFNPTIALPKKSSKKVSIRL